MVTNDQPQTVYYNNSNIFSKVGALLNNVAQVQIVTQQHNNPPLVMTSINGKHFCGQLKIEQQWDWQVWASIEGMQVIQISTKATT